MPILYTRAYIGIEEISYHNREEGQYPDVEFPGQGSLRGLVDDIRSLLGNLDGIVDVSKILVACGGKRVFMH